MTETIRQQCINKLDTLVNDKDISQSMEDSIYQWTVKEIEYKNQHPNWENKNFKRFYMNKLISLYSNLKSDSYVGNTFLLDRIKDGEMDATKISEASCQELFPQKWADLLEKKFAKDDLVYNNKLEITTDQYTCYRCKKNRCTYYSAQTRSSDESSTIYFTCLNCGNKWKFCN